MIADIMDLYNCKPLCDEIYPEEDVIDDAC